MSDPAGAVTDVAGGLKSQVQGTFLAAPVKAGADASGMDEGLVVLAACAVLAMVTMSFPSDSLLYPRDKND